MEDKKTVKEMVNQVEVASTTFEKTNTELKRKFLIWNIEAFNTIASAVSVNRGSFGTGYPFYVLDKDLKGDIPIISEQVRYNRQLVKDGEPVQKSIWECKECLKRNYATMPDLKTVCKPCPNMLDSLKPRKLINRLPDLDMWIVCKDGKVEVAQEELTKLLEKYNMRTSDVDPLKSLDEVAEIATTLKDGKFPRTFLPIDTHIMEESAMIKLIEQVPKELKEAKKFGRKPYLPIRPKSFRKEWQYDDEAYNFIYDYLSAFTAFNFPQNLEETLKASRSKVIEENTPEELFEFLMQSATPANFRRFQSYELERIFLKRVADWKIQISKNKKESDESETIKYKIDEGEDYDER